MADEKLVQELLASAQDALNRGFKIITVLPKDKAPFTQYSPSAVNSATRTPDIALKAWHDGVPANYGIACGMSNLCVVDADHGLNTYEEFITWRDKNKFPVTLTARSGNTEGFRVHMFYSGAVPTKAFEIDGVTGELKSIGGYVVGPGSIHPSGGKYKWIIDADIAPIPDGLNALAAEKKSLAFDPEDTTLIPAGSRWIHLQSLCGKLLNTGVSPKGMEAAVWDFLETRCEDGANYPKDKIDALIKAAYTKFDATISTPIIMNSGGSPIDNTIENLPDDAIGGDWIGDLTHELTKETSIPPSFMRATLKTVLGESLDGVVGFPFHKELHLRHWNFLIAPAETGKGASWARMQWLKGYMTATGIQMGDAGWYSSGENLVKQFLANNFEGQKTITHFDEMRLLFEKGSANNSTLLTRMLSLYDAKEISAGSLSNVGGSIKDVSVSITGGFTPSGFETALSGKGTAGDGFLSRCVLAYVDKKDDKLIWGEPDTVAVQKLQQKLINRWEELTKQVTAENPVIVPTFAPDAFEAHTAFQKWLHNENAIDMKKGGLSFVARLEAHYKRDLLLRTVFSDNWATITKDAVDRSVIWAKHELLLRRELWPSDQSNIVNRLCTKITKAFDKKEHVTKARLLDFCNVGRTGQHEEFQRAVVSMLKTGALYVVGQTQRNADIYGLYKPPE